MGSDLESYLEDALDRKVYELFKAKAKDRFEEASKSAVDHLRADPGLSVGRAMADALGRLK